MRPELAGALIRRARLEKNRSQEGLCRGICSVSWLSKIEAGREGADPELVSALFARLGLDMAERPGDAELIGRCYEAAFSLDYEAWDGLLAELRAARLEKGPFCLDAELLGRLFSDEHAAPGWARDLEPALGPGQRALLYWLSGDFEALCRLDGRAFALYLRGEEAYDALTRLGAKSAMELHKLAAACELLGKRDEALAALDRAEEAEAPSPEPVRELAGRICGLVRCRLEHPDYLERPEYGAELMELFETMRSELPIGYASFHLPRVLEWLRARRMYRQAYELLLDFPGYCGSGKI